MRALDRKLLRDLLRMRTQVATIALVVACGIASYVSIEGTHASLIRARDGYYERYRFADLFASATRVPDALSARIASIPGVALAYTRVADQISFPLPDMPEPALGMLVSYPARGEPALGAIALREGRMFEPGRADEAVVLEAFARAHGLRPGDRLPAVIAGIRRDLRVVGTALSPEYVFSLAPGEMMPDPRRFGVLWMDRAVVGAAFQSRGAWNDLQVRLQPGAAQPAVQAAIDRLLAAHGGFGTIDRDRQPSNAALRGELAQLEVLTRIMPVIFLGVAAFLINVVLMRLVQLQRSQIAALRAVGYRRGDVARHYLELVMVIVLSGSLLGLPVGVWLGGKLTVLYTKYFHFVALEYRLEPRVLVLGVVSSLLAAVAGALSVVLAVMRLPPAEAMRPEPPGRYRRGLSGRLALGRWLGHSAVLVARELERKPIRAGLSAIGVALGVAVLILGRFSGDAVDWFMRVQFELAQREDLTVSFRHAVPASALGELREMPGVLRAEGLRIVGVRYRFGHVSRESLLFAHPQGAELRQVVNRAGRLQQVPEHGLLMDATLARRLGCAVGDEVSVEWLEDRREVRRVRVSALVDETFGLFGHMNARELERRWSAEPRISQALLRVDLAQYGRLARAIKERPAVLSVGRLDAQLEQFQAQTAGQMRFTTLILTLFAVIIAGGVVYNNARIALSTRSRDLASLRVLGFRRREISSVLLGELAIQVALAIIPGLLLARVLAESMMAKADPDLYRFPVVISARTDAFAIGVTLAAALVSALIVRHRLDRLDLIGVLKSKE
ncbi:MAG TPA: ABC transporter permease [Polyangiales bacterium]|nr:ABC transporter permease [Polyangiales bacterium]